jgi:ribA/ribD-fused uncharacterized protein
MSSIADLEKENSRMTVAKYLFFWGHQPTRDGSISKTCFSQWFEAGFMIEEIYYPTAEHYMMAEKAKLFGDEEVRSAILKSTHPKQAKDNGRKVRNFEASLWEAQRVSIVVAGNLAKFQQNPELQKFLVGTGDRILVEASPVDKIWGIGLAADHPDAANPERWPGLNLLGIALMQVRSQIGPIVLNLNL